MANKPFTMKICHVKSIVKIYNKFNFKNSKYFQLLKTLGVLPSFHHYILAYLGI